MKKAINLIQVLLLTYTSKKKLFHCDKTQKCRVLRDANSNTGLSKKSELPVILYNLNPDNQEW